MHVQTLDARGIGMIGPINAKRPTKNAGRDSWPHQTFTESDKKFLPRGWDRVAFQEMPSGRWMQSLVWRDNKFVKLLSTVFLGNDVKQEVSRWEKNTHSYRKVTARLAVKCYQKYMPFVDQGDRNSSHFDIFTGKCKKRYHRRIFRWHLSFGGANNTMVLFDASYPSRGTRPQEEVGPQRIGLQGQTLIHTHLYHNCNHL